MYFRFLHALFSFTEDRGNILRMLKNRFFFPRMKTSLIARKEKNDIVESTVLDKYLHKTSFLKSYALSYSSSLS